MFKVGHLLASLCAFLLLLGTASLKADPGKGEGVAQEKAAKKFEKNKKALKERKIANKEEKKDKKAKMKAKKEEKKKKLAAKKEEIKEKKEEKKEEVKEKMEEVKAAPEPITDDEFGNEDLLEDLPE